MGDKKRGPKALTLFELGVILPTLLGLGFLLGRDPSVLDPTLLAWAGIVAVVELLPVPAWRGLQVSVGFPLLIVVAIVYAPSAAGLTALVGASDPREFRGEVDFLRALWNRCQVAVSVFAASYVFHSLADVNDPSVPLLVSAATLAAVADYVVNASIVTAFTSIRLGVRPRQVLRELRIGGLAEFLVSYLGLGLLGLILAKFYLELGFWSVPVFVLPLLFARQMFFRSRALEEAHRELQDREQVLRALSNRMAEERQDERVQIAAYLHDDLAQLLFRLSIQVDVAKRHLDAGRIDTAAEELEKIKVTKAQTSDRIRVLIRDLHRSPLGHHGLAEALHGFIGETARDADVVFHTDIAEVQLPPPIALLTYHIARESVMNALKHANAANMWITLRRDGDHVELVLRDDGEGFDAEVPSAEGHFGLAMMRERATVGGGSFELRSAPREGTTITVRFPTSLLQGEAGTSSRPEEGAGTGGASPGTRGEIPGKEREAPSRTVPA